MSQGDKMFKSVIWSGFERISGQLIQFVIGLILARLLTPEEYGILGLIMVFIVISQVFVDSGFSSALIQKKDRNENDISTVFYFNLFISILFYIILWIASPFIADFYNVPLLSLLLKVMSFSLILNALYTVPGTLYAIELDFKTTAKIILIASIISGCIAIVLAYLDYGVWALVWQTLIRSGLIAIGMWTSIKWKPNGVFSKKSFQQMFSYGSKLLISSLMSTIFSKLNDILIGKYIGTKDLGLYSRGIQFADFVFGIFSSIISKVFLPSLAPYQDKTEILVSQTRKIIRITAIVTIPILLGLALLAEPIILILLTDKWIMAVPIMQIFCISRLISLISGINVNLLYVVGKTNLVLKQEYLKIGIRVVLILSALKFGIFYIALAELIATAIHYFINSYFPGKIMNFGAVKQLKTLSPIILSGILMVAPLFYINNFISNDYLKIGFFIIIGLPIYIIGLKVFKISEFDLLFSKVKNIITKKK